MRNCALAPDYRGWSPVAPTGELSPHSRTSRNFGSKWPLKPDVCLEGGNVLTDGASMFETGLPVLSLRTTGHHNDLALTHANATSAASAQAARLAALAMSRYPGYWPETIRGLLTHAAEWTAPMRAAIDQQGAAGKKGSRPPRARVRRPLSPAPPRRRRARRTHPWDKSS